MAATPAGPTAKEQKYDRQLRLWGAHGQYALETATVCLVNATAAGCETLKNLILPAIGSFTVLDGSRVSEADCGSNFFVESSRIGESRAEVACDLLRELNADVRGAHVDASLSSVLADNPEFFASFNIVIADELTSEQITALGRICGANNATLLVLRINGLFGALRLSPPPLHLVVDSHPDFPKPDLRLLRPFPELAALLAAEPYAAVPDTDSGDVPYPHLIHAALQQWRAARGGDDAPPPRTVQEKTAFKALLTGLRRHHGDENINQAVEKCAAAMAAHEVPNGLAELFAHAAVETLSADSAEEWVVLRALRDFTQAAGVLPHNGACPDMIASSARFIALQNVYKNRSNADIADVQSRVRTLLSDLGRAPDSIAPETVARLVKSAPSMVLQKFTSIATEAAEGINRATATHWRNVLSVREYPPPDKALAIYFLFLASERFEAVYHRRPGTLESAESDVAILQAELAAVLVAHGLVAADVSSDLTVEFCRYGQAHLHSTAALMGGVAAQEVIKLLTKQFVPVVNSFVFNGIESSGSAYNL